MDFMPPILRNSVRAVIVSFSFGRKRLISFTQLTARPTHAILWHGIHVSRKCPASVPDGPQARAANAGHQQDFSRRPRPRSRLAGRASRRGAGADGRERRRQEHVDEGAGRARTSPTAARSCWTASRSRWTRRRRRWTWASASSTRSSIWCRTCRSPRTSFWAASRAACPGSSAPAGCRPRRGRSWRAWGRTLMSAPPPASCQSRRCRWWRSPRPPAARRASLRWTSLRRR